MVLRIFVSLAALSSVASTLLPLLCFLCSTQLHIWYLCVFFYSADNAVAATLQAYYKLEKERKLKAVLKLFFFFVCVELLLFVA